MALEIRSIPVLEGKNAERILQYMDEEKKSSSAIVITDKMWNDFDKMEKRSREFNYSQWKKRSV